MCVCSFNWRNRSEMYRYQTSTIKIANGELCVLVRSCLWVCALRTLNSTRSWRMTKMKLVFNNNAKVCVISSDISPSTKQPSGIWTFPHGYVVVYTFNKAKKMKRKKNIVPKWNEAQRDIDGLREEHKKREKKKREKENHRIRMKLCYDSVR